MDEWRARLYAARKRLRVSRERLAGLAGVSASVIAAYEQGRRHPRHPTLEALLAALRLERVEANAIREGAGFAPVRSLFADVPDYFYSVEELQKAVEETTWPQFVVNDSYEFVAANSVACAVWGVDFQAERARRDPADLNLLAVANEFDFPRRIENWDEILTLIAAMYKGRAEGPDDIAQPSAYLARVLARFTERDHSFLSRLIDAWNRAAPNPAKVRWSYPIVWNDPRAGRMHFQGLVSTANEREGLAFNDWIPLDAETWQALDRVTRKWRASRRGWRPSGGASRARASVRGARRRT